MQHFLYSVPALFVGIQASSQIEMEKFATEEHPNLNSFFPFRASSFLRYFTLPSSEC